MKRLKQFRNWIGGSTVQQLARKDLEEPLHPQQEEKVWRTRTFQREARCLAAVFILL